MRIAADDAVTNARCANDRDTVRFQFSNFILPGAAVVAAAGSRNHDSAGMGGIVIQRVRRSSGIKGKNINPGKSS